MGKFDDDLHLVEPSDYVPNTVRALLRHAGVPADATRADQVAAVSAWLKTHRPSKMMEFSIRDSGFGELLSIAV
ncbi:hypothetical protein [Mycolicibacterium llatzerense]|uniref:hypothetical protein n=1 Tax=Mycolicibacterium llatzerense TaxID=280871 RepID=UPI0021B5648D|nr:hypothetical protein [Mycolicibacterium llatzerense]MCT7361300.1 hypothetical protein [Mycolicibacterium llatzerense]